MKGSFSQMPSKTFTPKNSKIFVETSVLIAASIRMTFSDLGELRDEFYYPSINLFSLIRKNIGQRLGITTQTVEKEAGRALASAVINTLERNISDKAKVFSYKSAAWDICEANMRRLSNTLLREPIDNDELVKGKYFDDVYKMFKALESRALTEPQIIDQAHRQIGGASSSGMRNVEFSALIEKMKRDNAQLAKLARVHASPTDIRILAEAAYLARFYEKQLSQNPFTMIMASTDSNNFVPCNTSLGPSSAVTDEIRSRYKVVCQWPKEVFEMF